MLRQSLRTIPGYRGVHLSSAWLLTILAMAALLTVGYATALAGAPAAKAAANPQVKMVIAQRGTVVFELYPQAAPKTVAHFLELVNKKFYDGIKFHRIVPNFVAQAGDPKSKNLSPSEFEAHQVGTGGSGKTVPLEAKLAHERGTLGLARSQDPDSGDSQFYINLKANHDLDNQYCIFGKVIKGMNVVDKIAVGDRIQSMRVVAPAHKK
jgi:cyclophilin family peptidyl-prolyl cis-trans isomerase